MTDGYGDDDFFLWGFSVLHLNLRLHTYHGWIYIYFFCCIERSEGTIATRYRNRLYIVMVWLHKLSDNGGIKIHGIRFGFSMIHSLI